MPKSNLMNENIKENNPSGKMIGGEMVNTPKNTDDKVIDTPKLDINGNRVNTDGSLRPRFDINENPEMNRVGDRLTTTGSFVPPTPEMIDYSKYADLPMEPSPSEGNIVSAQNAPLTEGNRIPRPNTQDVPLTEGDRRTKFEPTFNNRVSVDEQITVNDNTLIMITPNCTMKVKIGNDWYNFESMKPIKVSRLVRDTLMGSNSLYLGGNR